MAAGESHSDGGVPDSRSPSVSPVKVHSGKLSYANYNRASGCLAASKTSMPPHRPTYSPPSLPDSVQGGAAWVLQRTAATALLYSRGAATDCGVVHLHM